MRHITLYSYCKSSAAYRVRIALNLKSINHELETVNLHPDYQENWKSGYLRINPQGFVPALKVNDDIIVQSSAIIEYLEETYTEVPLLPKDSIQRSYVRSLAQLINCDIHPLNNLRVLDYLKTSLHCKHDEINKWYCHWISQGLNAFEEQLNNQKHAGSYCCGDMPGIADASLIPQLYNARRFNCNISNLRYLLKIEEKCLELSSFQQAAPEQQIDYSS